MVALSHRRQPEALQQQHRRIPDVADQAAVSDFFHMPSVAAASSSATAAVRHMAHRTVAPAIDAIESEAQAASTYMTTAFDHSPVARYIQKHLTQHSPHEALQVMVLQAGQMSQDQPIWVLGLGLMVIGTFASALGMLCLRRAHDPGSEKKP